MLVFEFFIRLRSLHPVHVISGSIVVVYINIVRICGIRKKIVVGVGLHRVILMAGGEIVMIVIRASVTRSRRVRHLVMLFSHYMIVFFNVVIHAPVKLVYLVDV